MTLLGKDRPGLVEAVASKISAAGGNWLESRMCNLGGQFAGVLRVDVPEANRASLVAALNSLEASGLQVIVHAGEPPAPAAQHRWVALDLVGQDRPGIISQISHALAKHGVNVEELHTECVSAPMSGEPLFQAKAKLGLPPFCNIPALRQDLERIAADLMVDFTLAAR
jgi:glycine cleavage system regulatory protein